MQYFEVYTSKTALGTLRTCGGADLRDLSGGLGASVNVPPERIARRDRGGVGGIREGNEGCFLAKTPSFSTAASLHSFLLSSNESDFCGMPGLLQGSNAGSSVWRTKCRCCCCCCCYSCCKAAYENMTLSPQRYPGKRCGILGTYQYAQSQGRTSACFHDVSRSFFSSEYRCLYLKDGAICDRPVRFHSRPSRAPVCASSE